MHITLILIIKLNHIQYNPDDEELLESYSRRCGLEKTAAMCKFIEK